MTDYENESAKQCSEEIKKVLSWIKKPKENNDEEYLKKGGHCNNYSSHCCLSCDRCWGGKKNYLSPLKDKKSCEGR